MGLWNRFVFWVKSIFMTSDEKLKLIAHRETLEYFEDWDE